MARYIDAERLKNEISGNGGVFVYGPKAVAAIVSRINAQPTADVVEVVRCKDCKCYVIREDSPSFCKLRRTCTVESGFCNRGERSGA